MTKPSVILALARDLCLKLLDRRNLSAANLPQALIDLAETGQEIVDAGPPGWPLLRLAGTLTVCQIDRGWIGNVAAVQERLKQNAQLTRKAIAHQSPEKAKELLQLTVSLAIKLIETNGVSSGNWEPTFLEIAKTLERLAD
ncbi:MAG: hypothetical protein LBT86_10595 [Deltaproteobacteria bacterium]|jgi:hypothetical protein|nr:hypothetical protein [Deltaproteobacteria bacterium]